MSSVRVHSTKRGSPSRVFPATLLHFLVPGGDIQFVRTCTLCVCFPPCTLHAALRAQSTVSVSVNFVLVEDQAASTSSLFHNDTASLRVSPPVSYRAWCRNAFLQREGVRGLRVEELMSGRGVVNAKNEPAGDSPRLVTEIFLRLSLLVVGHLFAEE